MGGVRGTQIGVRESVFMGIPMQGYLSPRDNHVVDPPPPPSSPLPSPSDSCSRPWALGPGRIPSNILRGHNPSSPGSTASTILSTLCRSTRTPPLCRTGRRPRNPPEENRQRRCRAQDRGIWILEDWSGSSAPSQRSHSHSPPSSLPAIPPPNLPSGSSGSRQVIMQSTVIVLPPVMSVELASPHSRREDECESEESDEENQRHRPQGSDRQRRPE
jgi:hypothetical protein